MFKNRNKRYVVTFIGSDVFADREENLKDFGMGSKSAETLEEARRIVQNKIGSIASNPYYTLEKINWMESQVEMKFNYRDEDSGKVRETVMINILAIDRDGQITSMKIGDW